jgi:DNA-binding transcriptional LysR family regulator
MTQQEIQVFLSVVKMGSVSGAAQALYITQPAVSRHIRALEQELGCPLLERGRGKRQIELTPQGQDFVDIAKKWNLLWQEARDLSRTNREQTLNVASVSSISSYLLPMVLQRFLSDDPQRALTFHDLHSSDAYSKIEDGVVDIALISDDMYHPQVETIPAFREPMILVSAADLPLPDKVHPSQLDPTLELRCPWNPEFDLWHSFWFSSSLRPLAVMDQMALLESFFRWAKGWAITPLTVAKALQTNCDVTLHQLEDGPPDRIIYYLLGRRRKPEMTAAFLSCLEQELGQHQMIESFL